jgi:hypothetical protein
MSYTEVQVESLMPSVWDREYAWGVYNPQAPDADMPTAKYKSPKESTTFWCGLIDIRTAWVHAPLTMPERRTLLLHYGFGWEPQEIAHNQSVTSVTCGRPASRAAVPFQLPRVRLGREAPTTSSSPSCGSWRVAASVPTTRLALPGALRRSARS